MQGVCRQVVGRLMWNCVEHLLQAGCVTETDGDTAQLLRLSTRAQLHERQGVLALHMSTTLRPQPRPATPEGLQTLNSIQTCTSCSSSDRHLDVAPAIQLPHNVRPTTLTYNSTVQTPRLTLMKRDRNTTQLARPVLNNTTCINWCNPAPPNNHTTRHSHRHSQTN